MVARPLTITIVTPAARGARTGNRVTALRWAGLLRQLGHRARLRTTAAGAVPAATDVLVTVHAVKSADAVLTARAARPRLPIVTLLSGTDIYPAFAPDQRTARALDAADALVALQPRALDVLPPELRRKARTIVQSATPAAAPRDATFSACLLSHLRPVKDPLVAVTALGRLPTDVPIKLRLAGDLLDADYGARVLAAVDASERAEWLGLLDRVASKRLIARSHVCLVPSLAEGGANVVSEAIAAGTPVLCSAIPGNLGLLGDDWPATFPPGDAAALAHLLARAASDRAFLDSLCTRTRALQPMVAPATERAAWRALLADLPDERTPV